MKVGCLSALTLGLLFSLCLSPALAGSEFLDKAIAAYNAGKYDEAMGLLGEAESREFNDPVLHYYLANTLSHLDVKDDAIKEYKIALAMQPVGQMAQYCHDALRALGAESKPGSRAINVGEKDHQGRSMVRQQSDPVGTSEMDDDRERIQQQINQIRQRSREIISDISRDTPDRHYAIKHFRDEAQRQIQALRDQFMHKWHSSE